ncbi:hypothetical protein [Glaciecola sp. SC05]|uniref:hypothetical protein n=1 Tax=Glaciecola sp. SC05 TaxID=1987355 RepID=UPI003528C339
MRAFLNISLLTLLLVMSSRGISGEVNISGGVALEYTLQAIDDKTQNTELDSNNLILRPFVAFSYESRDLGILATATHNNVRRSLESEEVVNNYTDYNYFARYQVVRNLLSASVNGSQNFRSQAANSFLVDNFLLNADNLRKNTINGAALNLNLPTGRLFGINAQVAANKIVSENEVILQSLDIDEQNFVSNSYNGTVRIEGGRDLRPFIYDVDASFRVTDRENQQDFESQILDLMLGSTISSNTSIRLLGYYENNDITNDVIGSDRQNDTLREFYSYGIGLAWQPSNSRFIEVGLNRSTTVGRAGEDDVEDDYLSLDMQWSFSSRTSFNANYSRRFFGESGSLRFSHNLRNWRNSISYSENLATNSQLLLSQEDGLLICANGSTELADCRLSDGLDQSNLGPGEVLVPFVTDGFELNDRVILRKAITAQSSVDMRRTTLSASLSHSTNEEVEIARTIETLAGRIGAALRLSSRSTLSASISYSDIERMFEGNIEASVVKQANLELERRFTRRLFGSIGYNYLDRAGDNIQTGGVAGINGPLTDNRITLQIRYEYDSNR